MGKTGKEKTPSEFNSGRKEGRMYYILWKLFIMNEKILLLKTFSKKYVCMDVNSLLDAKAMCFTQLL